MDKDAVFEAIDAELVRGRLQEKITAPATGLRIIAGLTLAVLAVGLLYDAWLLLSGGIEDLAPLETMSKREQVVLRASWSLAMVLTNALIFVGAGRMAALRDGGFAVLACGLALIPCLGPCFIAGIPFAVWALIHLRGEAMRLAFEDGDARWKEAKKDGR